MTISLPGHRQVLIDKDARADHSMRRWMEDMTRAVQALQAVTITEGEPAAPSEPNALDAQIVGVDGVVVVGTLAEGYVTVGLEAPEAVADGDVDGGSFTDTYSTGLDTIDGGSFA